MIKLSQILKYHFKIKFFLILLLSFFHFSCSTEIKNQTSLEKMKLNGKVESLKITQYKAIDKFGEITTTDTLKDGRGWTETEFVFDKKGNNIKEILYSKSEGYSYLLGKVAYSEEKRIYEYKYDDYNNLIEKRIDDRSNTIWKYTYDVQQNLITEEYWKNEKLSSKKILTYDEFGNEIEMSEYDSEGDLKYKEIIEYSIKDGIKYEKSKTYGSDGELKWGYNFEYDSNGNMIKSYGTNTSYGTIDIMEYSTNNELLKKTVNYSTNNPMYVIMITYDDFGNINKETKVDYSTQNDDYEKTYKYEFDEKKNWIKKIEYSKVNPVKVVLREIKYY